MSVLIFFYPENQPEQSRQDFRAFDHNDLHTKTSENEFCALHITYYSFSGKWFDFFEIITRSLPFLKETAAVSFVISLQTPTGKL